MSGAWEGREASEGGARPRGDPRSFPPARRPLQATSAIAARARPPAQAFIGLCLGTHFVLWYLPGGRLDAPLLTPSIRSEAAAGATCLGNGLRNRCRRIQKHGQIPARQKTQNQPKGVNTRPPFMARTSVLALLLFLLRGIKRGSRSCWLERRHEGELQRLLS